MFGENGNVWSQQQELTASDAGVTDRFGWSVAVSGDVAIVGANLDDDMGTDSGSAYVFQYDGDVWTEVQKLTASDATTFDLFGWPFR